MTMRENIEPVQAFVARLKEFIRTEFRGNWAEFSRQTRVSEQTLNGMKNTGTMLSGRSLLKIAHRYPERVLWLLTGQDRPQDSTGQKAVELDKLMTEAEFRTLCIKVLRMEQKIEDLEAQARVPSSGHTGGNAGKGEEEEPETP